jgi:enterochelin esterase-like enzyme
MGQGGSQRIGTVLDTNLSSRFLGGNRGIHVYLPSSYRAELLRRYPVLYLHDGQNVFSSTGTDATFGWGGWELDRTVDALCRQGKMQEIIMIAVDNSSSRLEEYSGMRHPRRESSTQTAFEKYEEFLVRELKSRVDNEYRTLPEAGHTAIMGSSLGGLCSLVLAWDHPRHLWRCSQSLRCFHCLPSELRRRCTQELQWAPKTFPRLSRFRRREFYRRRRRPLPD